MHPAHLASGLSNYSRDRDAYSISYSHQAKWVRSAEVDNPGASISCRSLTSIRAVYLLEGGGLDRNKSDIPKQKVIIVPSFIQEGCEDIANHSW